MIGYCLKNDDGKYLSMSGDPTDNWFEASKFDELGIESRKMYLKCGYELFSFEVNEYKTPLKLCGEYCGNKYNAEIKQEGIFFGCEVCNKKQTLENTLRIK